MPLSTELQPEALPPEQIGWFKVLGTVASPAEDVRTLLVWHPFHHTRCTLTLFPGIDALQRRTLLSDARKLRTINHPALIPVLDVVESGKQVGLLAEGIGGYSLRDCLDEVGALEVDEAVAIFRQLLSGVAALHHYGVTHGDLRPENIQLDVSGEKLIARLRGVGRGAINRFDLHSVYLAPELASGGEADPRADVYSLGCIFYECLAGRPPYQEVDPWSRRQEIRDGEPAPLQNLVARLPMEVAFAINSALKFHAGERFANARAFGRALPSESRLHTEEVLLPRESSEELITGLDRDNFSIAPDPHHLADTDAPPDERERPPNASPNHRRQPAGKAPASSAENHPTEKPPVEKPDFLGPDQGLGDRVAAAPVDAVIMGSRLLRILGAPLLATIFLVTLWNWNAASRVNDQREDFAEAVVELEPIFARSIAMADEVIAVGVEPNQIRPLVSGLESASSHEARVQAGHTLVSSMFRLVRSLRSSDDASLNKRRRSLEVQLNALDREYAEYKEKDASLQSATEGTLVGWLTGLLR